jgi:hypothetical protein
MERDTAAILTREITRVREEIERIPFGSVSVTFTIHNGRISRILRGVERSEKPSEPAPLKERLP